MTDLDLDEGERLIAEAETAPPWATRTMADMYAGPDEPADYERDLCAGVWAAKDAKQWGSREIVTTDCGVYGPTMPDASMLVWSVNNAPALIAEVRRLRALVAELTADANATVASGSRIDGETTGPGQGPKGDE